MNTPQPFDPGYDYEQDKAIEDRLMKALSLVTDPLAGTLMHEAAREIRALRNLIKHMERRINSLIGELYELREPDDDLP